MWKIKQPVISEHPTSDIMHDRLALACGYWTTDLVHSLRRSLPEAWILSPLHETGMMSKSLICKSVFKLGYPGTIGRLEKSSAHC